MRVRLICLATLVIGGGLSARPASAQSLSELVPADSLVYVGWRGTMDPGPGFAASKWEAAIKESHFNQVLDTLPAAGLAAEKKYPGDGVLWRNGAGVLREIIRRPSAAFLAFDNDRPRGGLLCRAGSANEQLSNSLQTLASLLPRAVKARVVTPGDTVGLIVGYEADTAVEGGLDQQADFKKGLAQCVADPMYVLFVNVKSALARIDEAVGKNAPAIEADRYRRFIDASGFSGVNFYIAAAGFSEKEWQLDAFIDAPAPRKGLLAIDATTALDADLLKHVPASASTVTVFRLDANAALKTVRDVANEVDPAAGDLIDKLIGGATMAIGKNVQIDLLASLGNQWAVYTSPDVGGSGPLGLVAVNKLANPTKAKQALASLSIFLSNSAKNAIPDKSVTIAGRMVKVGDLNVYYAAMPVVSPAWTIKDNCLYMGAFPQTVIAAARYGGASIDSNAAFAAVNKPVDGHAPLAVTYTDVTSTLADGYGLALAGSRTLLGLSDVFLTPTTEPVMPPLPALQAQAGPATGAYWADDSGLHMRARSPFPGAETVANLSISDLYFSQVPMLAGALLPSMSRSSEEANRIKSASNLRQIGLGCVLYANALPNTAYPPDFNVLQHTQELTADVFLNPRTATVLPPVPPGVKPVDVYGPWSVENGDYVYLGAGKFYNKEPADSILAYERPERVHDGINVLFADGHVEWISFDHVPKVFADAKLPSPMPAEHATPAHGEHPHPAQ